jgi:DNA polymerase V
MTKDLQEATEDGVSIHSGFPNPASDRRGQSALALDLNQLVLKNPASTYLFRVEGHSYADQGIYDGDIAVIDRALEPRPQDLILACQDDNFMICKTRQLLPDTQLWGVVTATIHKHR